MLTFFKSKIEIVELKNGKFAVMKTFWGEETFYDPTSMFNPWRKSTDCFFEDCQFTSIEAAECEFQKATGNVVKKVLS
jgi:hypothetical protein